jgi:hypothetical protein
MFETISQAISSLDQPSASSFAQINIAICQDYSTILFEQYLAQPVKPPPPTNSGPWPK